MIDDQYKKNLTDEKYWDTRWSAISGQKYTASLKWIKDSPLYSELHKIFINILPQAKLKFLEVGCGGGKWLIYFNKIFGYDVFGIDISNQGLIKAKSVLNIEKFHAHLVLGDIHYPPFKFETFDVILSDGLLEHFSNPLNALSIIAKLCKPGGIVITLVPNITGIQNFWIKIFNKRYIFSTHKVIRKQDLIEWYASLNFTNIRFYTLGSIAPKVFSNKTTRLIDYISRVLYHKFEFKIDNEKVSNTYVVIGIKSGKSNNTG